MTDEIIESLPEKLRGHRCKLKKLLMMMRISNTCVRVI